MDGAKNVLTNVVQELQATHDMITKAQNATKSFETATQTVIQNVEVEAKQCLVGATEQIGGVKEQIVTRKTAVEDEAKKCVGAVREEADKFLQTVQTESKVLHGVYSLACLLCGADR